MADVHDFKSTSKRICAKVFKGEAHDWQIGFTKVFIKVSSYMHMHIQHSYVDHTVA